MKILKAPNPAHRAWRTGCMACQCEFSFTTDELPPDAIERRGPNDHLLSVNCPSCNVRGVHRLPPPALIPA